MGWASGKKGDIVLINSQRGHGFRYSFLNWTRIGLYKVMSDEIESYIILQT